MAGKQYGHPNCFTDGALHGYVRRAPWLALAGYALVGPRDGSRASAQGHSKGRLPGGGVGRGGVGVLVMG